MSFRPTLAKKDRLIEQLQQDNQNLRYCIGSLKHRIKILNTCIAYYINTHKKKAKLRKVA